MKEEKFPGFFWAIGVPKIKNSKNIEKIPNKRVAQKSKISHQTPLITLFLDSPSCIYKYIKNG